MANNDTVNEELVGVGGGYALSWKGSSMKSLLLVWLPLGVALLVGGNMVVSAASPGAVTLLRVPDGGLQPQAVLATDGTLHLIYLKGDPGASDVFYAKRERGRTNLSPAVRVNSRPGSAVAIGTVRGAQTALGR